MKKHTNEGKKYWKGSRLNVGTDKKQDWIDCDKLERFKFDEKDLNNRYYICLWFSGQPTVISDLSEEQHNDIRFEILDYLDKL